MWDKVRALWNDGVTADLGGPWETTGSRRVGRAGVSRDIPPTAFPKASLARNVGLEVLLIAILEHLEQPGSCLLSVQMGPESEVSSSSSCS